MLTCLPFPDERGTWHVLSCRQKATRLFVQYRHSHLYRAVTGAGCSAMAVHRVSHLAAPALTSSTTSRHALISTLKVPRAGGKPVMVSSYAQGARACLAPSLAARTTRLCTTRVSRINRNRNRKLRRTVVPRRLGAHPHPSLESPPSPTKPTTPLPAGSRRGTEGAGSSP